jgi:hypothetical protein
MFILYAVFVGLVIGLLTGGAIDALGRVRIRWAPVIAIGMVGQLALFSSPVGSALGDLAPWMYVATNVAVLAAVLRNLAIPGLVLVFIGGAANVIAIVANGGYMPVSAEALAAMGRGATTGYSNSRLVADVALAPLTDIFAMPTWVPAANVFSVGDICIGVGIAIAIVASMHGRAPTVAVRPPAGGPGP